MSQQSLEDLLPAGGSAKPIVEPHAPTEIRGTVGRPLTP